MIRLTALTFKQGFTFIAYSKSTYDKTFEELMNYKEIRKTKDAGFIKLVDSYKKWSRIYLIVFNTYFFGIIILGLISFIVAITIQYF